MLLILLLGFQHFFAQSFSLITLTGHNRSLSSKPFHCRRSHNSFTQCYRPVIRLSATNDDDNQSITIMNEDNDDKNIPNDNPELITLDKEEKKALREVQSKFLEKEQKEKSEWYNDPGEWAKIKTDYPLLAKYTDAELRRAYLNLNPTILDVFVKTPIGPMILVNLGFMIKDKEFYLDILGFGS